MRYIIVKTVFGFDYFWNSDEQKWEGVKRNATILGEVSFNAIYKRLRKKHLNESYTYILNDKRYISL